MGKVKRRVSIIQILGLFDIYRKLLCKCFITSQHLQYGLSVPFDVLVLTYKAFTYIFIDLSFQSFCCTKEKTRVGGRSTIYWLKFRNMWHLSQYNYYACCESDIGYFYYSKPFTFYDRDVENLYGNGYNRK